MNCSKVPDAQLETLYGGRTLVLTETRLRTARLEASFQVTHPGNSLQFRTRLDGYYELLYSSGHFPKKLHRLSDAESSCMLMELVAANKEKLPHLFLRLFREPSVSTTIPPVVTEWKKFLDSLRLNDATGGLIQSIIDEFGAIEHDRQIAAELLLLGDEFQFTGRERGMLDSAAVLGLLLEIFESPAFSSSKKTLLPSAILIDHPTTVSVLEARLWRAIQNHIPVFIQTPWLVYLGLESLPRSSSEKADFETRSAERKSRGADFSCTKRAPQRCSVLPRSAKSGFLGTAPSSLRYLDSVCRFLRQPPPELNILEVSEPYAERHPLVQSLFDGKERSSLPSPSPIEVWACADRREEARQVAFEIASRISNATYSPSDFHIVCFELDAYREILTQEFKKQNVSVSIAKGRPMRQTPAGAFMCVLLDWISEPTLRHAKRLFGHPLLRSKVTEEADVQWLNSRFPTFLRELREQYIVQLVSGNSTENILPVGKLFCIAKLAETLGQCGRETLETKGARPRKTILADLGRTEDRCGARLEQLKSAPRDFRSADLVSKSSFSDALLGEDFTQDAFLRFAFVKLRELSFDESRRLEQRKLDAEELLSIIAQYGALLREVSLVSEFREEQTVASAVLSLATRFARLRKPLQMLRRQEVRAETLGIEREFLQNVARSLREVRRLLRFVSRSGASLQASGVLQYQNTTPAEFVLQHTRFVLIRHSTAHAPDATSVNVSELLDARGLKHSFVFVLGVLSDSFPVISSAASRGGSLLEELASRVEKKAGAADLSFESHYLLGSLFRNSSHLVFSYPEEVSGQNVKEATFLETLREMLPADAEDKTELSPNCSLPHAPAAKRAAAMLSARSSNQFTEYDGVVALRSRKQRYSIAELETLADCPHRFYFKSQLGLEKPLESFSAVCQIYTGKLVHEALEKFYPPWMKSHGEVTEQNFSLACTELNNIATELFLKSALDWDSTPVLRAEKQKIVRGLNEPGDASKRGLLKAALAFQRDYLKTYPMHLEYPFGTRLQDNPVVLQGSGGEIQIRGVIDRVDAPLEAIRSGNSAPPSAVWDYKTGKVPALGKVVSGKKFQVPIYALAVKQHFGVLPERGGCIALGSSNVRGDAGGNPRSGVLREHLGVEPNKRNWEVSPAVVESRVQLIEGRIQQLDTAVNLGVLHQIEDTEECPRCEFQDVCARDEAQLEKKLYADEFKVAAPRVQIAHRNLEKQASAPHTIFPLNQEQSAASNIHQTVVLSAGAGSGKTTVLKSRILELLLNGASLTSILAITFTEKAALEIRQRLERDIYSLLRSREYHGRELADAEVKCLVEVQAQLTTLHIGTIHSFAQRVLRIAPELAGIESFQAVLSTAEQTQLAEETITNLFEREAESSVSVTLSTAATLLETLLDSGLSGAKLKACLKSLLLNSFRLQELKRSYPESRKGRDEVFFSVMQHVAETKRAAFIQGAKRFKQFLFETLPALRQWLDGEVSEGILKTSLEREDFENLYASGQALFGVLDSAAQESQWQSAAANFRELIEAVSRSKKIANKKKQSRNFWKELRDAYEEFARCFVMIDELAEREAFESSASVVRLAVLVEETFKAEKRKRGAVDFNDLILGAHTVLTKQFSGTDRLMQVSVVARLRQTIRHILVDEFQDTDKYQWEMLQAILGSGADGSEEERTLFIVGDPQQSIYGFRGGDVRVFNAATEEILTPNPSTPAVLPALRLSLQNNYRSRESLVRFVNGLFENLFRMDFDAEGVPTVDTAVDFQEMHGIRHSADEPSVFVLNRRYDSELSRTENGKVAEAGQVAAFVRGVLLDLQAGARSWPMFQQNPQAQVAILTRKVDDLLLMAHALEAEGVPFSISHSSGFFELEEIIQFQNLLKYLSNKSDFIALVGVLRSAIFGLSDQEILSLYEALNKNWHALEFPAEESDLGTELRSELQESLQRWRGLSGVCSVSRVLEIVVHESGMQEAYSMCGSDGQYRNIMRFIEHIRAAENKGALGATPSDALEWLEGQRFESRSAPSAHVTSEVVTLTTVHGAKGLEYEMVILPFLGESKGDESDFVIGEFRSGNGNASSIFQLGLKAESESEDFERVRTSVLEAITLQQKARAASEERRLFYVACTRAKDYLVLSFQLKRAFREEAEAMEDQEPAERADQAATSQRPRDWLMSVLDVDDTVSPSEWRMTIREGEEIVIPIIDP